MSKQHNPMDSAALAAGAIAAVLAVTGPKGPYDIISAVTGFVITMVLIAYELPVVRSSRQNIAFGLILSLSSLPIAGYLLEVLLAATRRELSFESFFNGRNIRYENDPDTAVPRSAIFLCWLVFTFVYWSIAKKASKKAENAELNRKETDLAP